MSFKEAKETVALWLHKKDELQQAFMVAEDGFYKTFFGGKKRISWGNFEPTVGDDFRKIKCFGTLMAHLKKWKLLPNEKQSEAKKEEIPQNPNDKEQNTIVEDKKGQKGNGKRHYCPGVHQIDERKRTLKAETPYCKERRIREHVGSTVP